MKAKRIVAIGILTITAIGLVGCAIILGKKNDAFKPKTMETSASYDFTTYNPNNHTWTITGKTNINPDNTTIYAHTYVEGNYTITKTTTNLTIQYNFDKLYNFYQNTMYTSTIDRTITQVFTNNEQPTTLQTITLMQGGVEINYDAEEETNVANFYIETFLNYGLENRTYYKSTNMYLIENNQPYDEDDSGLILDQININTTINTIENAYQTGWTAGNQGNQDIVDIRGLMLNILTMPFTFISQAFNVTLWEGTPYAFNISNFIKGMIAIATILFIIKLFTSGFNVIGNYTASRTNTKLKKSQTELNKAKTHRTNKLADKGK